MKFCEKLILLRRKRGFSQEQLADYMNVSRQSVSKWEADKTMPELSKLKGIADLFQVSLDYLLRDEMEEDENRKRDHTQIQDEINRQISDVLLTVNREKAYEFKSKTKILGIPLVHIHISREVAMKHKMKKAKGIIAIGDVAFGVIAIGYFSSGLISLGLLSIGILSAGLLAMGGITIGVVAAGIFAFGVTAVGIVAAGVASIGIYATGVAALGKEVATGISVCGKTVIGVQGKNIEGLHITAVESLHTFTRKEAMDFILRYCPDIPSRILHLITFIYK